MPIVLLVGQECLDCEPNTQRCPPVPPGIPSRCFVALFLFGGFTVSVASSVRRMAKSAMAAGVLIASSGVAAHAQASATPFLGKDGNVFVRYVGSTSIVDRSILAYKIGNGAYNNGAYMDLFTNLAPGASAQNTQQDIGFVANGTEVFFRLTNTTQASYNTTFQFTFYDGAFTRNPDGVGHVAIGAGSNTAVSTGTCMNCGLVYNTAFSFEDRSATVSPTADGDLNDLSFEIAGVNTTTPEPSSVVLMATGILALGVAARRRRKV